MAGKIQLVIQIENIVFLWFSVFLDGNGILKGGGLDVSWRN